MYAPISVQTESVQRASPLQLAVPGASVQEAAAIAAALERFIAETAAHSAPARTQPAGAWKQAALVEGVARGPAASPPWQ